MTRTLILMRHAKSSWDDPRLDDHDRPLNKRGIASATAMGEWLRSLAYRPDVAVSSSSARTRQTFEGLCFDVPVTFTPALYHAGAEMMMEVLQEQTGETVLMLGHNPGIADFADRLVARPPEHPRFADYPTCATAVIRFEADAWNDIGWREGQPIDFAIPREVIG
ncbi:MAG: histidine phosphatase family protein [Tateyamaria sp.]